MAKTREKIDNKKMKVTTPEAEKVEIKTKEQIENERAIAVVRIARLQAQVDEHDANLAVFI